MANPHNAVSSFDFVKNPSLEEAYTRQREIFRNEGKTITEAFLFHGTAVANIDSILRENLSLELSTEQQGKERKRLRHLGVEESKEGIFRSGFLDLVIFAKTLLFGVGSYLEKLHFLFPSQFETNR